MKTPALRAAIVPLLVTSPLIVPTFVTRMPSLVPAPSPTVSDPLLAMLPENVEMPPGVAEPTKMPAAFVAAVEMVPLLVTPPTNDVTLSIRMPLLTEGRNVPLW